MSDVSPVNPDFQLSVDSLPGFDLGTDYFSVFSVPEEYAVDLSALKVRYLNLQQSTHPDRKAGSDEKAQREAVQLSAYLNQAYDTLKSPLKRAIYMLERKGVAFNADSETHSDTAFLMSQLELRERLESAGSGEDAFSELDQLAAAANKDYVSYQEEFYEHYSNDSWDAATQSIHKMMFASKLLEEIRLKEELLDI